jgi:hypothetical protein
VYDVTVEFHVLTILMKDTRTVVGKDSQRTIIIVVATLKPSGHVMMDLVSLSKMFAMVKLNAETNLMKRNLIVASKNFHSTTEKSVAAIQRLNYLVMDITSSVISNPNAVTVKFNALLLKMMKEIRNVASKVSITIAPKSVAATLKLSGLALMVNASVKSRNVMEELNAQMSLMKVTNNVASESTLSITIKNADVKKINSNVVTVIVSAELAIDGKAQCKDGSDEGEKQCCFRKFGFYNDKVCGCNPKTQWTCANGQCISNYNYCDGKHQCADRSDENMEQCCFNKFKQYDYKVCGCNPDSEWACADGTCIPK